MFAHMDDSDMKIVGDLREGQSKASDESEAEARLFEEQRQNGNLEKAHALGLRLAGELLEPTGRAYEEPEALAGDLAARHRALLFAFVADQAVNSFAPNALIAQSAENVFYDELRRGLPALYEAISRTGAFSRYLLCPREGGRRRGVGEVFARVQQRAQDAALQKEGEALYDKYFTLCQEELQRADFAR